MQGGNILFNKVAYLIFLLFQVVYVIGTPWLIFTQWGEWNTVTNRFSKRANLSMSIIAIIILLGIEILIIPDTIRSCRDIPSFLIKNYKVEVGSISDRIVEKDGDIIYVNNIELKGSVDYKDLERYINFKFYYLPNTHRIMEYVGIK